LTDCGKGQRWNHGSTITQVTELQGFGSVSPKAHTI
jgi:hypothetical protein